MVYEFTIIKDGKYFKSGICTKSFKEIFEKIIAYGIIKENIGISFTYKPRDAEDSGGVENE